MNLNKQNFFKTNKPLIMGILNLTPDSFSDGGEFNTAAKAVQRAKQLQQQGADIIDIGGESTGPGSKNVKASREIQRIMPALQQIKRAINLLISLDTYKSEVAQIALEHGVDMVNDVTALRGDKNMAKIIAKYKCPVVLMYAKDSTPRTTIKNKQYRDIVKTIKKFWQIRINYALKQGIQKNKIILDPGMGHFISSIGKYSYEIIARLPELTKLGYPVLIGASRKSFLGGKLASRDVKSALVTALACLNGACIIRTHDVKGTKQFLQETKII